MSDPRPNADARKTGSDGQPPISEPSLVDANPDRGFHYPYYLTVPEGLDDGESRPILVEPHNVGQQIEEFEEHLELAKERMKDSYGRRIADDLEVPYLIPVFPRPFEDPVDWTHMVHMLDAKTMEIEEGPLERVDLQLLRMIDDAQERLADWGWSGPNNVILNGFSAQAAFVNRFSALHPSRVCSVSVGGFNGLAILPEETADVRGFGEQPMNYPVGVANVAELTGNQFAREAFCDLHQFLYMGSEDDRDALLYPDAWTKPKLRGIAVLTYGEDIHDERFPTCEKRYEEAGVNAVFRMYEDTGHTPEPAEDDIVEFHERTLAGDDIESISADLTESE